jgi:hypothetical protein
VIGTNAWIDGFGYLRQNDYIADHAGYRILKAKTVFVGKDRPIEVGNEIDGWEGLWIRSQWFVEDKNLVKQFDQILY